MNYALFYRLKTQGPWVWRQISAGLPLASHRRGTPWHGDRRMVEPEAPKGTLMRFECDVGGVHFYCSLLGGKFIQVMSQGLEVNPPRRPWTWVRNQQRFYLSFEPAQTISSTIDDEEKLAIGSMMNSSENINMFLGYPSWSQTVWCWQKSSCDSVNWESFLKHWQWLSGNLHHHGMALSGKCTKYCVANDPPKAIPIIVHNVHSCSCFAHARG